MNSLTILEMKVGDVISLVSAGLANGNSNGNTNGELPEVPWDDDRDCWWHDEMEDAEPSCYPAWMAAEDPLFILYTRSVGDGSGKMMGVVGVLVKSTITFL